MTSHPLRSREFILLCAIAVFFFTSLQLLTPTIPLYFKSISFDGPTSGLLLAAFMAGAVSIRPLAGKLCDEIKKKNLMLTGVLVFLVCSALYGFTHSIWGIAILRILQGMGFAVFHTASNSYTSKMIPAHLQGAGISLFSNFIQMTILYGPPLSLYLADWLGFTHTFLISAGISLACILLISTLPYLPPHEKHLPPAGSGKWFHPAALLPGLAMMTNGFAFSCIVQFLPLIAEEKHLHHTGLFYTVFALHMILSRGFTGPLSDKMHRKHIAIPCMLLVTTAFFWLSHISTETSFLVSAAVYGLGAGGVQTILMALVADRSPFHERGAAVGTFTMLTDTGLALGSFFMACAGDWISYNTALILIGWITLGGVLLLTVEQRILPCKSLP